MSHYEIDYSSLSETDKDAQAIQDIISYLGQERFDSISAQLREDIATLELTVDDLYFPLAFAGVRGYPVDAWFRFLTVTL